MRVLGKNAQSNTSILGGNAVLEDDGTLTISDIGGTGKDTIDTAIQNLGARTDAAKSDIQGGRNIIVTSTTATDGHTIYTLGMNRKPTFEALNIFEPASTGMSSSLLTTLDNNGLVISGTSPLSSTTLDNNGLVIFGGPSVTNSGIDGGGKKITQVASGNIDANSTDAVTGAQLFSIQENVSQNQDHITVNTNNITANQNTLSQHSQQITQNKSYAGNMNSSMVTFLGGNVKVDNKGTLTISNIGGTGKDTIDAAIRQNHDTIAKNYANITENTKNISTIDTAIQTLGARSDAAKSDIQGGGNIIVTSTTATDGHTIYTLGMNSKPAFEALTTGKTAGVRLDGKGLFIVNGPNITTGGIDAGGQAITRVGTGELQENGDNAATTGQLFTVNRNVKSVTSDIESLRTELTDVKTSVEAKADKTDTGAWTLAGTGKDSSPATAQIGANSKVSFTGDDNLEVVTGTDGEDSTVAFALNADVNLDSATFGDTVIDTTGLRLAKGAVKLDGEALNFFDPASTGTSSSPLTTLDKNGLVIFGGPSITTSGIDAGGKKITRVGTGELQENGDNAATTGQLFTVNRNVKSVTSDIESLRTELTDVKTSVEAKADKTDTGAWTLAGTGKDSSPATAQIGANSKVSFTGDDNLEVVTGTDGEDSTVAFALNADVNLDSATFGDTVIDTTGLRLAKGAVKLDGEALNFFDPASTGTSSSPLTTLDKNGLVIFGGPKVTTGGIDAGGKKITRVGTGELQENGDNAATTGQLFTVNRNVKSVTSDIESLRTELTDVKTSVEAKADKTDTGAWTLAGTGKDSSPATAQIGANSKVSFTGDDNLEVVTGTDGEDSTVAFALNADVNLDSATFGDTVIDTTGLRLAKGAVKLDGEALNFFDPASTGTSSSPLTTLDKNGLVIFGGPKVTTGGIDAGGKKITRVGTGELQENGDNAATTGQLFTVNRNVKSVTSDIESLRTELTDVKTSVEAKADKTDTGAWTLAGTGKDSSPATAQIGANSKVSFTGDDNLEVVTGTDGEDSTVAFALNADVNLDSATFGDTVIDTTGLRLAKGAVKLDGEALNFFDPASTGTSSSPLTTLDKNGLVIFGGPSITTSGIDAGGKKITRVGTGELQENGDNAATTGQLFTVNERLKTLENSGSKDKTGKGGSGESTTSSPPSHGQDSLSTTAAGDAWDAEDKVVTNVGEGKVEEHSRDVVNGDQLYRVRKNLENRQKNFQKDLDTMARHLDDRIDNLDTRARAGIASALASAALPQAYLSGESVISAAAANYRGEQALSIGASTVSNNGRWIVKGTANVNRKDASVAVGIGYKF